MKGYVPQQLNTDRRFSVQNTSFSSSKDEDEIINKNHESVDNET